ncbi:hypothetical protein NE865_12829 [Phthorimaea operculella]|nr:hypothetical protein NE865_12829 [Phthorimaea operculella]
MLNDTASYIQVEVRRARRSTRLPAASSPAHNSNPAPPPTSPAPAHNSHLPNTEAMAMDATGLTGAGEMMMMPAMLTCTGAATTWQGQTQCAARGCAADPAAGDAGATHCAPAQRPDNASEKNNGLSVWRKMSGYIERNDESDEDGRPERMEVYYFEHGCGAWLATTDCAHEAAVERLARRAARRGRAWLAEALAVPRLVAAAPLAALVGAERAALVVARGAVVGAVQTAADYALKPALALVFNALLHPPLVFAGNTLRAVRDALRPVWGALGDALDPLARLLASVRLVHVHIEPRCSCANAAV